MHHALDLLTTRQGYSEKIGDFYPSVLLTGVESRSRLPLRGAWTCTARRSRELPSISEISYVEETRGSKIIAGCLESSSLKNPSYLRFAAGPQAESLTRKGWPVLTASGQQDPKRFKIKRNRDRHNRSDPPSNGLLTRLLFYGYALVTLTLFELKNDPRKVDPDLPWAISMMADGVFVVGKVTVEATPTQAWKPNSIVK